ncbi:RNA polymerase sigma factor [Aquibacillus kalidii]|uniref:RNA polymerase sigma factor n=1 Tax=Aquibacillus kalidii TaxID=2762597 RepID=UPI0016452110|nr:RNA polymerase sigma factor [Aquibacillus kalidii]
MELTGGESKTIDFNYIYESFYRKVYQSAWYIIKDSQLAEDIAQETFIKAYKHINDLKESYKVCAWLTTIATRTAIDTLRKERKQSCISIDDVLYTDLESLAPLLVVDKEVDRLIRIDQLNQEVIQLSPKLRHVFFLKYLKDYKDEEIARQLNISLSAVKTRLYRARKILQDQVESKEVNITNNIISA